jgi:hypothetical protein
VRNYLFIAVIWIASLVAVGATVYAQVHMYRPLPQPRVIEAPDVGFRVTGMTGDVPTGQLVIRVNGEWVEARLGGGAVHRPVR